MKQNPPGITKILQPTTTSIMLGGNPLSEC